MFFDFDSNTMRIKDCLKRFSCFLIYGPSGSGKHTYLRNACSPNIIISNERSGYDLFGNRILKIKEISESTEFKKNTIYISDKNIQGIQSLPITFPSKSSKISFLIDRKISNEVKEYIINNNLSPLKVIMYSFLDYIPSKESDIEENVLSCHPDSVTKILIDNYIIQKSDFSSFGKIKLIDFFRYNKEISNKIFSKNFDWRIFRRKVK